jgi:predicted regulator of Ras-like GTPase activity (Roadblock/LC7/MglB family)
MKQVLDAVLTRLPGARGVAVVGPDGIAVESAKKDPAVDMEWAAAGGIDLLRRAATPLKDGAAETPDEITISGRNGLTVLRGIGAGYFLCLVTAPGTLTGRARYEAWRTGQELRQVLE